MSGTAPKKFQYILAFFGTFAFIVSFQIADWLNNGDYFYIGQLLIGYDLGFLLSFSLLILLEILRGNGYRFIDSNTWFKPISYFCLLVIFSFSVLGIWSTNYYTISYGYNTAYIMGSIVCAFGLVPVISHHDQ